MLLLLIEKYTYLKHLIEKKWFYVNDERENRSDLKISEKFSEEKLLFMNDFQRSLVFAQQKTKATQIEGKNSLRYQILGRVRMSKKQIQQKTIT